MDTIFSGALPRRRYAEVREPGEQRRREELADEENEEIQTNRMPDGRGRNLVADWAFGVAVRGAGQLAE